MRVMGPFDIGEVLARGGSSVVHASSWHDDPTIDVVAKVASAGAELRLHHENAVLREIDHPHVIVPVGFVDDGSGAALVLPRAVCSLRAHRGRLSSSEVAHVAVSIAEALGAMHRAGYAHGDVSPSNVLLREDGSALLADFGSVARCTTEAAHTDVEQLAATCLDSLAEGDDDAVRTLLAGVSTAPISALDLASMLRELVPDAQAPDPFTSEVVVDEPPTMAAG